MPNSIDFDKRILLHVIPVRIIVPCFQTVKKFKNMEDKILDCVNYIKNITKQKVTSERIFLYKKKNDESVSEEEIQKLIATLRMGNRY